VPIFFREGSSPAWAETRYPDSSGIRWALVSVAKYAPGEGRLCTRGHTVLRDGITYTAFCFDDPSHADLFRERLRGERFDAKDRGRGSEWFLWHKG
jgi:hypothetical protein